jgi:hypothetical protein
MAGPVNLIWAGARPLPAGYADIVMTWHVQNPDFSVVFWLDAANPDFNAARQSFRNQPMILVQTLLAGAVPPGGGSAPHTDVLSGLGFTVTVS